MTAGRFVTFEGIEGVGKTTQVERVHAHLAAAGRTVVRTREPGGTPLAERIRAVVLDAAEEPVPAAAELLLMFAARAVHTENRIRPALAHPGLAPDLTILLDAPVQVALARARSRTANADRIEAETVAFFERARAKYLEVARREPDRVRVVDATRTPDEVAAAVLRHLAELER